MKKKYYATSKDKKDWSDFTNQLENVYDKGLSIGEKSKVYAKNIVIKNSGVGVAIKDSSFLELKNFNNTNSFIADILSINKKNFFDHSTATINSNLKLNPNNFMIENGNKIYLNGILLPTKEIDVEELYKLERMRKNGV